VATYTYPTAVELTSIEPALTTRSIAERPIFKYFPIKDSDADMLLWEQRDNYFGLMQVRGLNGEYPRVVPTGAKRYRMEPGYYGEFMTVDEAEMTRRSANLSFTAYVDISDLVRERQDRLAGRQFDRMELQLWTLLATGTFSVAGPSGAVLHTDSYTTQTFTATVPWATVATATPLADLRSVQVGGPANGVDFGAGAVGFMNRTTYNSMVANTNAADLYGRRTAGLGTFNNLQGINQLTTGDDLPTLMVYDKGYLNDSNTFARLIPNNKVVVIGTRPAGEPVGEFRYTRNANTGLGVDGPAAAEAGVGIGVATQVVQDARPPRNIEVYRGFNGGPVLYWPSAVYVMTV
jgi:hypothetical protein